MAIPIGMRVQLTTGISGHIEGLPFGKPGERRQRVACDDGRVRVVSIEQAIPKAALLDRPHRIKPRLRVVER